MLIKPLKIGNVELKNNIILAPMAGVTDLPFRLLCKQHGCGLVYSEMISAKGFKYGNANTKSLLTVHRDERPVSVQIFGAEPEIIAHMVKSLDSDDDVALIDINMGCPMHKIVNNSEGSALMKNPELVAEIVAAASKATKKPVTVKIRKGFDEKNINAVEIAKTAERSGAAAIAIHGRTRTQYYEGEADWEIIKQVKAAVSIPVIGNGDVVSAESAEKMLRETCCDGIMIGRAAQGNPWIFEEVINYLSTGEHMPKPGISEIIETALLHTKMLIDYKGERTGISEMRKHLAKYTKGMPDSAKLRVELTRVENLTQIEKLLNCLK